MAFYQYRAADHAGKIVEGIMEAEAEQGVVLRLHEMGCIISLDDFGRGYSSLAYLARLPVDDGPRPAWFDGPRITYCEMLESLDGECAWRHADAWPPRRTTHRPLYLQPDWAQARSAAPSDPQIRPWLQFGFRQPGHDAKRQFQVPDGTRHGTNDLGVSLQPGSGAR
mgnify:CR=1 FL=1